MFTFGAMFKGKVTDAWQYLRLLTIKRVFNAFLLVGSYLWSRATRNPKPLGLPMSISFEPTTACNLRCPECPSGLRSFTRPTGHLPDALFRQTIDQLAPTLTYLLFYFQGEPYLHPRFLEHVQYAAQKGIYTATSTNGHYLDEARARKTIESGLHRLIISIDGATQETYAQYRIGGQLSKVLQGTRTLVQLKKAMKSTTPHIIFQCLVVKPNEHQVKTIKQMARELGVNEVRFKTAQIYDYENGSPLIPTQAKYSRYKLLPNGQYAIKNKLLNHCWKMWHSAVITWNGTVVPCCFDKDATHQVGQLGKSTFKQIWQGPAYNAFRSTLLRSRSEIEMCKNCTVGTKVWA